MSVSTPVASIVAAFVAMHDEELAAGTAYDGIAACPTCKAPLPCLMVWEIGGYDEEDGWRGYIGEVSYDEERGLATLACGCVIDDVQEFDAEYAAARAFALSPLNHEKRMHDERA